MEHTFSGIANLSKIVKSCTAKHRNRSDLQLLQAMNIFDMAYKPICNQTQLQPWRGVLLEKLHG
jgi:hypothetical protein